MPAHDAQLHLSIRRADDATPDGGGRKQLGSSSQAALGAAGAGRNHFDSRDRFDVGACDETPEPWAARWKL